MNLALDLTGLLATLTLVEQDVSDAGTALSSATLVDWVSPSATLYQEALAGARVQLTSVDTTLANARTSLVQASA